MPEFTLKFEELACKPTSLWLPGPVLSEERPESRREGDYMGTKAPYLLKIGWLYSEKNL